MKNILLVLAAVFSTVAVAVSSEITDQQRRALKIEFQVSVMTYAPVEPLIQDFRIQAQGSIVTDAQVALFEKAIGVDASGYALTMSQFKRKGMKAANGSTDEAALQGYNRRRLVDMVVDEMDSMKEERVRNIIAAWYVTLTQQQRDRSLFGRANSAWNHSMGITETSGTPYLTAYSQMFGEKYLCDKVVEETVSNAKTGAPLKLVKSRLSCSKRNGVVIVHRADWDTGKEKDLPLLLDLGDGVVFIDNVPLTKEMIHGKQIYSHSDGKKVYTLKFIQD